MTTNWPAMSIAEAHALLTAPGSPLEMETVVIRGRPTRTWKNAPPTLRDVFIAGRAHDDKIFLVHEDERVSFEAFARATLKLAAQLRADGVVKGDRIAVVMRNLPEWPVAFFAASLCGAIVTPLNAWWTGAELEYGLSDSGTRVLLVDADPQGTALTADHARILAAEQRLRDRDALGEGRAAERQQEFRGAALRTRVRIQ